MTEKLFITTTLPYCNGNMHVGAAFEFILADSLNRYFKSVGKDTYLNIGLDQNGSKILAKSKEFGLPVEEYIKNVSEVWIESCNKLNIGYDNFYQTSTKEHAAKVQNVWNYFVENGDIYLKEYTGKYCVGCESFKLEKDLIENKCNEHPKNEIHLVSESNYFFNLKKYKKQLFNWLTYGPLEEVDKNELTKYLNDYEEISVSRKRTDLTFGIEVPNDPDQIIYVWLDALCNYLFAANDWVGWDNVEILQLCGKDNLRFQAQIWQSFLSALGNKNSDRIFIHGTILDKNGKKMSKSEGNVVDPIEQVEKHGLDAVRYYTLAGLNTTQNSSWDEEKLVTQFNAEICNDWGNLVSRVLHLIDTKLEGKISHIPNNDFVSNGTIEYNSIQDLWENLKIKEALQKTNELVKTANKYINDEKPWGNENFEEVLCGLYFLIQKLGTLYSYVFPYKNFTEVIEAKKKVILFEKLKVI